MSEASNGRRRLVRALRVQEHAKLGFGAGMAFAVGLYVLFVLRAGSLVTRALYVTLLVVLALSVGAVVTTVLVGAEAYKLAAEDGPPDRR
ncbi:hypothetical protein Hrd1104_12625 [Halorhabdus sp. CBA1104]|uniref:DUF7536 family protein n=1 Tax=unclassified Halorhabdus TaxID=2621901 RepID=UPI0012B23A93|nr:MULTISPECIES: hypothetical protein [unclassified Halorhabdus]QGN08057.1 hypothetical protein Hrd1104_12625 [Halorhabdus sp. CBA1104]